MITRIPPEIQTLTDFLMQSNAIEGVYDSPSFHQAYHAWQYLIKEKILNKSVILKTHKLLMLNQPILGCYRGYFRDQSVWVGGREGVDWRELDKAIEHWALNVMDLVVNGQKESEIHRERMCREHHVEYEKIHPFIDGNGRTGRMFMNWERLQLGLPILVIHEWQKQDYYNWFRENV